LKFSEPGVPIEICGKVSDRAFHLWIKDGRSDYPLARPIVSNEQEQQELGLGLKVVKKIVDLYDGTFMMNNNDRNQTTIYLTLPLAL
jgi:two-component system, sensor histidine kinase and response regulator